MRSAARLVTIAATLVVDIWWPTGSTHGSGFTMMAISWGVISGAFLGPYIWGMFSRRVGKASTWAGFAVGVGFTLLVGWHYDWNAAYMPVISSIATLGSLAIVPVVALFAKPASDECIARAFGDEVAVAPAGESPLEPPLEPETV